jgi:predicted Zn-dependent peptidase
MDEIVEEIDAVSMQGVNDMAKSIFTEHYSVALISPEGELPKNL